MSSAARRRSVSLMPDDPEDGRKPGLLCGSEPSSTPEEERQAPSVAKSDAVPVMSGVDSVGGIDATSNSDAVLHKETPLPGAPASRRPSLGSRWIRAFGTARGSGRRARCPAPSGAPKGAFAVVDIQPFFQGSGGQHATATAHQKEKQNKDQKTRQRRLPVGQKTCPAARRRYGEIPRIPDANSGGRKAVGARRQASKRERTQVHTDTPDSRTVSVAAAHLGTGHSKRV